MVAAIVGATLVVGGVVFFYVESDLRRLVSVSMGLGIVMIGVWFAAHPFVRSTRRFKPLRKEVDEFVDLVRVLNAQAVAKAEPDDVARTAAKMHEAVERLVTKAGQTS